MTRLRRIACIDGISEVHRPGIYDLEVDTSTMSPEECGQEILRHLKHGPQPTAFKRLAAMSARDRK